MTDVLVVGGGLAGLAAALDLAKAGLRVTLAERRAFPGGRAYSFRDPSGAVVDNGQHVFLECCSAYRAFVEEIGAGDLVSLQQRTEVPFVDLRTGRVSWLREALLPAPFHFLPSILRFQPLSGSERRRVLKAGRAMRRAQPSDDETLGAWLRAHGQSEESIRLFWNPAVVSILNEHVDHVSAEVGLFVFRTGFLEGRRAARVGIPEAPLGDIAERAVSKIRELGGTVEFNRSIERLPETGYVVSAVPPRRLLEILPPERARDPFFGRTATLETSPIVNLHFLFDAPVAAPRFFAAVGGRLQWVFTRGGTVTISQSGARDLVDRPNADLEDMFLDELRRALNAFVHDALPEPRRCVVVRERNATFVPAPGSKRARLPCRTPLPNLFLAGEWTEGEWPSTMEAAVRSGRRAAAEVIRELLCD